MQVSLLYLAGEATRRRTRSERLSSRVLLSAFAENLGVRKGRTTMTRIFLLVASYLLVAAISISATWYFIPRQETLTSSEFYRAAENWANDVLGRIEAVFESGLQAYAPRQERCGIEDNLLTFQGELVLQYGTFMDQWDPLERELISAYLLLDGNIEVLQESEAYHEAVSMFRNMETHLENLETIPCGEF